MAPPPRYTSQQITAAVAAVLDEGISQQEAIRRAAAGTLQAGLEPFRLHKDALSRAKMKAELDRAKATATADPRNAANTFARRALTALEASNRAMIAQLEAGKDIDHRLRDRARTLRELVALQGGTERKTAQKQPPPENPKTAQDLSALLASTSEEPRDTLPDHESAQANSSPASHG